LYKSNNIGRILTKACREDEFAQLLRSKRLWPVEEAVEQNWSGRGEHLHLSPKDREFLDSVLKPQAVLGRTSTATVESVKCRRILLARKTISCNRHLPKEKALEEFAHLKKFGHAHIVRVIGTYVLGRKLSILMYPVARYNLEMFLEAMIEERDGTDGFDMQTACKRFFSCLSSAVNYIHSNFTKHMDIKPQNILVHVRKHMPRQYGRYTALITDFGIARSYQQLDGTDTDGPTMFTRKYAAPEVVSQDRRGLPADIFSLGCVFLEMMAALNEVSAPKPTPEAMGLYDTASLAQRRDLTMDTLQTLLESSESGPSYYCNIEAIFAELARHILQPKEKETSNVLHPVRIIRTMMMENPLDRPSARAVLGFFNPVWGCCDAGPLPLEDMRLQLGC
jgi:serine/threonine protein kinase